MQYIEQLQALNNIKALPGPIQTDASRAYGKAFQTMMIATVPFVAVGFLISLTAQEADLGRRKGEKNTDKKEESKVDAAEEANVQNSDTSSLAPGPNEKAIQAD